MKLTFYSFCLYLYTALAYSQQVDSTRIIEIPVSYADHEGEPLSVFKDSLYIFRSSNIYLINGKSFFALKKLYESTKEKDEMTKDLLENYRKTLMRNFDLENKFKVNFAEVDDLDRIVYNKTQETLKNTQRALDYTLNSLEKASNSLEIVGENVKRQKRKDTLEKIMFIFGGLGVGVLIGSSL